LTIDRISHSQDSEAQGGGDDDAQQAEALLLRREGLADSGGQGVTVHG
jgi:hypothetical protein